MLYFEYFLSPDQYSKFIDFAHASLARIFNPGVLNSTILDDQHFSTYVTFVDNSSRIADAPNEMSPTDYLNPKCKNHNNPKTTPPDLTNENSLQGAIDNEITSYPPTTTKCYKKLELHMMDS